MTTPHLDQDALVSMKRVSAIACSPCGEHIVFSAQRLDAKTSSKYVSDLWLTTPTPSTTPRQLTHGEHHDTSPTFDASGNLHFLSNRPQPGAPSEGSDARTQLWRQRPGLGEPTCITDEPLGVSTYKLSSSTGAIAYITSVLPGISHDEQREVASRVAKQGPSSRRYTSMPVRRWDHWLPNARPHLILSRDGERLDLTPNADLEHRECSFDISADGSKVAFTSATLSDVDHIPSSSVMLFDASTNSTRTLASRPRTSYSGLTFLPDGERLLATRWERTDGAFGTSTLVIIDGASGAERELSLTRDLYPLDIQCISQDGAHVYLTTSMNATAPIVKVELDEGSAAPEEVSAQAGTHHRVRTLGSTGLLATIHSSLEQPPCITTIPNTLDEAPTIVADISGFDPAIIDQVEISTQVATSTDGETIQYWVVKPKDGPSERPTIMWIHGGPIGDWGDVWHWRWNSLIGAARGYTMILPNPRGSTGFGAPFVQGIWGNTWGKQCYEDLMAIADKLEIQADIDAARFCAMGGSFGGYMTNWIGTQTDRFACLVSHAGLFDLSTFHAVTDLPAWWEHMFGTDPLTDRDEFDRYSPRNFVSQWSSPVLIIHGQLDYRVPVGEALGQFAALQKHGKPSELLIYPDENHWILKPNNIKDWYSNVFEYIDGHLLEEGKAR